MLLPLHSQNEMKGWFEYSHNKVKETNAEKPIFLLMIQGKYLCKKKYSSAD